MIHSRFKNESETGLFWFIVFYSTRAAVIQFQKVIHQPLSRQQNNKDLDFSNQDMSSGSVKTITNRFFIMSPDAKTCVFSCGKRNSTEVCMLWSSGSMNTCFRAELVKSVDDYNTGLTGNSIIYDCDNITVYQLL